MWERPAEREMGRRPVGTCERRDLEGRSGDEVRGEGEHSCAAIGDSFSPPTREEIDLRAQHARVVQTRRNVGQICGDGGEGAAESSFNREERWRQRGVVAVSAPTHDAHVDVKGARVVSGGSQAI